jgi:TRAP-type C4-dicarboxylate transport system permease small subunit
MLYICWLVLKGSLEQTKINLDVLAPSTQWPVAIVYAAGVFFSISGGLMLLLDLWLLVTGQVTDDQLVMVQESEDAVGPHAAAERPATAIQP